jgi:hypothetical protein
VAREGGEPPAVVGEALLAMRAWPTDGSVPDAAKLALAGFNFDGELHDKKYFFTFFL